MVRRIIWPTMMVCGLWLMISIPTTVYLAWLESRTIQVRKETVPSARAARTMQMAVSRLQAEFIDRLRHQECIPVERLEHFDRVFNEARQSATDDVLLPEEPRIIDRVQKSWQAFREFVGPQGRADSSTAAGERNLDDVAQMAELGLAVTNACEDWVLVNRGRIDEAFDYRQRMQFRFFVLRAIYLACGPVVGVFAGLWIARSLRRSISEINVKLSLASGDLEKHLGTDHINLPGIPVQTTQADELQHVGAQVEIVSTHITEAVSVLLRARQKVVDAERLGAIGTLAAGVAHEIRNPLTSIKLLIQTAPRRDGTALLEDRPLGVVLNEISRMEDTVKELLEFAKPPQLQRIRFDLRDSAHYALSLVHGRARQREATLMADVPAVPIVMEGDRHQLQQLFVNLLINALDAVDPQGRVEFRLHVSSPEDRMAVVTVADDGPGIVESELQQIFQPFRTTKPHGVGLGLALCKEIAERHEGAIEARNRAVRGAEFVVRLPRVVA
ncbi:MAG: hypothetical protein JSS02_10615 [Planctomycetes bacterium]|nr:hypothetical protein [Planctomycetota bacterium]